MSLKSSISKNVVKNSLKSIKIITFIGVASLLCTQFITANELGTTTKVPAAYNVSELSSLVNRQVPAGYVKANYKAVYSIDTLSKTPDSKDLSLLEAAEIAAQEIFKFYGEKLDDKTIEMAYSPRTSQPSTIWSASVTITPYYRFIVEINACTGELHSMESFGGPDIDKKFAADLPLIHKLSSERQAAISKQVKTNRDALYEKAKQLITQRDYISEPIKSIRYVYMFCGQFAVCSYGFEITTASDKIYDVVLSHDFTQLTYFLVD